MITQHKKDSGFSHLIILLVIAVITFTGFAGWFVWQRNPAEPSINPKQKTDSELVVPPYVGLYLVKSYSDKNRQPVLHLEARAGGGCDSASALKINKSQSVNQLSVEIEGYKFKKGPSNGACPAVITESTVEIPIDMDWLKPGSEKLLSFKLSGKNNTYKLSNRENKLYLVSQSASNVISNESGFNPPAEPKNLELSL